MKAENVVALKSFAGYVLSLEADVLDLVPELRISDVINGDEFDQLTCARNRSERCNLLFLEILPKKKDSALDTLRGTLNKRWGGLAEHFQKLIAKQVPAEGKPFQTHPPLLRQGIRGAPAVHTGSVISVNKRCLLNIGPCQQPRPVILNRSPSGQSNAHPTSHPFQLMFGKPVPPPEPRILLHSSSAPGVIRPTASAPPTQANKTTTNNNRTVLGNREIKR